MAANRKQKKKIEAQLDCKATAELNSQIVDELLADDKSLSELLETTEEEESGEV